MKAKSVSEYIAAKPKEMQRVLREVRAIIRKAVPKAEETISYQIPAYRLDEGFFLFFAGWKEHYSLYPVGARVAEAFKKELAPYKLSKGTVRLPYSEPVPAKLIERIAKFRAKETTEHTRPKGGGETQLQRVRRLCATMPSVFEKPSHGAPTFFVEKDKGGFLVFASPDYHDGHPTVWAPAKPGMQAALIGDAPDTYFRPKYVGAGGWIGIKLEQIKDDALAIHIREAWELSNPKRKKAASR